MIKKIGLVLGFFFVTLIAGFSQQKYRLAMEYYNSGEYEKSAEMFEALYKESPQSKVYFNWYMQCLLEMKAFDKATKVLQSEIKKFPNDGVLSVNYGNLLERQGQPEKAEIEYKKAIEKLEPDPGLISNLANTFTNLAKYNMAIETYLKGEKITKVPNMFVYQLADLYRRNGDTKNMIKYYLLAAEKEPNSFNIQTSLQRFLEESDFPELQRQLYLKIQEKTTIPHFGELLQWTFVQKKEYDKAMRQAKALDRQFTENGNRVFQLASLALSDKDYDTAIDGFEYIIKNQGRNTSYYLDSKRGLINSKKAKVTENFNYSKDELNSLKAEYLTFLDELGRNTQTATLMQEYADFEAYFMNDLDKAIEVLEEVKDFGGLNPEFLATIKLSLGDYYLTNEDKWEASLLYSQVDKDFKEGQVGENARYRNAMLSYYSGDFEWAQEQFKILKGATSKLISNDAIDRSVFILDNTGMDTTLTTLQMYANAELMTFQNKYDDALNLLDSIVILFPEHSIEDDILYTKAQIYKKLRKVADMIAMYEKIIEKFPEEIRADNAIFELAEAYETKLNDPEKAKTLYEKLFIDYSASTFAIEARHRFRRLRGDNL